MNRVLLKETFKEIRKSYRRFISILLMAMLGVGFFVGIKATAPGMKDRLDDYFDNKVVFDLKVMSTMGLTDEDIEYVRTLSGVKEAYGVYENDVILEKENTEYILKAMEYNSNLNQVVLIDGSLPKNENECVIEEKFISELGLNIGDTILIKEELQDGEAKSYKTYELKVVGIINSPLYISVDRGTSKLDSGKINYYIYVSGSNINIKIYTSIYIIVDGAKELKITSKKYDNLIKNIQDALKKVSSNREQTRYDLLVSDATKKVNDAEAEMKTEKAKAQKKISKAENDLKKAESEITKGEKEVKTNIIKADKEFADAEKLLKEKEEEYILGKIKAEEELQLLKEQLDIFEIQLEQVISAIDGIMSIYDSFDYDNQLILDAQLEDLIDNKEQLENGIKIIEETIEYIISKVEDSELQLRNAKTELEKNKLIAYSKLTNAKKELSDARKKMENGKIELEKSKIEFINKIKDAEGKITDAKEKISKIEFPKWYVLNRKEANAGYRLLMQDSESIGNIGKVFPLLFFIVAALTSLTSMTRMIDEQRTGIGTLKALGYTKIQISSKYIIYSVLATLTGSIIGVILGYNVIPSIIITAYLALYSLPASPIVYDFGLIVMGILFAFTCIVGGAVYSSYRKLKYAPAQLMRPKAPKPGKRVFIERLSFIWNRLTFFQKVTLRNIFRYKKRFLMTIMGIGGATALIVVGFGIRNSVSKIASSQYEDIYNYQISLGLKNSISDDERNDVIEVIENKESITKVLHSNIQNIQVIKNAEAKILQLMIVSDEDDINDFITLRNSKTKKEYNLDDKGIIITERISKILGIKKGDTILIKNEDDIEIEVLVSGITEHYISHYMYMTKALYKKLYDEDLDTNFILIKTELNKAEEQELGKDLLKEESITSVNMFSDSTPQLDKTMETLDLVMVVLVVSAGLLAFVVLYSLSNVNISERTRELATLKVLGFYDKEVDQYVNREMIILTTIGILFGLVAGYYLTCFVLQTVEQEFVMYPQIIKPISYLYSSIIVIAFTFIVSVFSHYALKKINMIESLKSVE